MKKLFEMRLTLYSVGLFLSSALERVITNYMEKQLKLFENYPLLYHFVSIILLIFFFVITNVVIHILINSKWISKKVFGRKFVGGHWIEIVFRATNNEATHYCDLEIGYDIDKIYLSGTDYDPNYTFMYNLETESATMENYGLSYIYKCIGGKDNRKGYGTLAFHKKASSSPDRYTGRYSGDDNEQYIVEGFLISDKKILKALDQNFISTFDTIIKEKKQFLFETEGIKIN